MAYNLPNLTPQQMAMPLLIGAFYRHPRWSEWHDLELRSFNAATGACTVSGWNRRTTRIIPISTLRARYVLRRAHFEVPPEIPLREYPEQRRFDPSPET